MNYIDRRKFLKNLAVTLAGSTTGLTLNSCILTKAGYRTSDGSQIDHDALLSAFKDKSKSISKDRNLTIAEDYLRQRQCNPYMIQDSVISLLAVGTFGDLPEKDRNHPAVQQMLWDSGPLMDRATMSAATYLEQFSTEELLEVQKTMKEHPEILGTFQVEFDAKARENNIPSCRLDHFNAIFNKCVWRLENQDPSLFIDEVVKQTDKACKKFSITPEQRRAMVAQLSLAECHDLPFMDDDVDKKYTNMNDSRLKHEEAKQDTSENYRIQQYEKWKARRKTGLGMILFGLVQFAIGSLITLASGLEGIGILGLTLGMTGGALVVIVGIIITLVSAIAMSSYQ